MVLLTNTSPSPIVLNLQWSGAQPCNSFYLVLYFPPELQAHPSFNVLLQLLQLRSTNPLRQKTPSSENRIAYALQAEIRTTLTRDASLLETSYDLYCWLSTLFAVPVYVTGNFYDTESAPSDFKKALDHDTEVPVLLTSYRKMAIEAAAQNQFE